eukprot:6776239-Ditylum_brightwellii.AAC.1
MDQYMLEFVKELQQTLDDPPVIDLTLISSHIKANYKYWAENTSTSLEGRHLGLYKTWVNVPEEKGDDSAGITSNKFFEVLNTIIKICQQHQIQLPWWLNAHNLFILKKSGVFKIHRLCTLHKLESE